MKTFNATDIYPQSFRNQMTWTSPTHLNEDDRIYFITGLNAAGAWTMKVTINGNAYTRTGTGNIQFFHPICGENISFTGASEVSGFYLKTL